MIECNPTFPSGGYNRQQQSKFAAAALCFVNRLYNSCSWTVGSCQY